MKYEYAKQVFEFLKTVGCRPKWFESKNGYINFSIVDCQKGLRFRGYFNFVENKLIYDYADNAGLDDKLIIDVLHKIKQQLNCKLERQYFLFRLTN